MARAMARAERSILRRGVIAGLIGASVVALWFFLLDLVRGTPFLTPAILGSAVFFGYGLQAPAAVEVALAPILGYTVLHGLAFIAFGVIAATVMAVSEREPALFVGFVILFAAFEMFFLGVVTVFFESGTGALVWWAILAGNGLASVAMLWYLFRFHRTLPGTLVGSWGGVLGEGVVAGLLGAAAVAVWFLVIDAAQGQPLRTPRVLGTVVLGQPEPLMAVLYYTVVHGAAFAVFGMVAALLIAGAERQPAFVFALVILFTAFEVFFFGWLVIAAEQVLDVVAAWTIFVANLLAAAVMLAWFLRGHRGLAARVAQAFSAEE